MIFRKKNVLVTAMLLSGDVWAVYGVMADLDTEGVCSGCSSSLPTARVQSFSATPLSPTVSPLTSTPPFSAPTTAISTTSAPPAPTAKQTQALSPVAKIGIGVAAGILGFALAFVVIFDACYLRRRRRERAMLNAIEEVERAADKESQDRIVLESRVSIVFEEEGVVADEARNGMSLPRRTE